MAGFLGPDSPLALTLLGCIKEALVVVGRGAGEAHRGLIQEVHRGNNVRGGWQDGGRVEVPLPSFLPWSFVPSQAWMEPGVP